MSRNRTLGAVAVVGAASLALVTLAPEPQGTQAQWRQSSSVAAPDATADTLTMTVQKRATTFGPIQNSPGFTLTNTSRQTTLLDVRTASVQPWKSGDTQTTNLIKASALSLSTRAANTECAAGGTPYWSVAAAGSLSAGTDYPRPSTSSTTTLAPSTPQTLCADVANSMASSTSAERAALLRQYAARGFSITLGLQQRTQLPATWESATATQTTDYRVALPPPVPPTDGRVCVHGLLAEWYWGWPSAADTSTNATPAINRSFIVRQEPDGTWQDWLAVDPAYRHRSNINSNWINGDDGNGRVGAWRQFRLRLYPYANDNSIYVDSTWTLPMRESSDRVECGTPVFATPQPVGLTP